MGIKYVSFFSAALFSRKSCVVYLPPGYESSEKSYPVIYMLHGMHGTEVSWTNNANAHEILDRMIKTGELPECIAVMPNDGGYGHGTFYVDWYDGTGNFEQYFLDDLIPFIDREFRTKSAREGRLICGYSMGGFGAFSLALRRPDLFAAASSMSGGLGVITSMPYREFARSDYARMIGPQNGVYAQSHDIGKLAAQRLNEAYRPELYFDCGKEDFLYPLNVAFHDYLNSIQYPHTYQEFSGGHTWEYWTEHLPDTLRFFSQILSRSAV